MQHAKLEHDSVEETIPFQRYVMSGFMSNPVGEKPGVSFAPSLSAT